jgi:hypothetical protein
MNMSQATWVLGDSMILLWLGMAEGLASVDIPTAELPWGSSSLVASSKGSVFELKPAG